MGERGDEYKFAILVPKIDLVGLDRTGYYPLGQAVIHRGWSNFSSDRASAPNF